MQKLFAILWPHYVPRSVMTEIKQLIEDYFKDHSWKYANTRTTDG